MTTSAAIPDSFGLFIRIGATTLVAAVLAALTACVSAPPSNSMRHSPSDAARVRVVNGHVQDMRISVIRRGARIRLGRVGSMETRTFPIDRAVLGTGGRFRFQAEPIPTGDPHRSVEILLDPGRDADFLLAANLKFSTIALR